jgi:DnaJ-domain-containing protein 1
LKQVILEASCVFTGPLADPLLMEHFSSLALSIQDRLNQDLLAESLATRRASSKANFMGAKGLQEDLRNLGRALSRLAAGEKAKRLAWEIRLVLDPASEEEQEQENSGQGIHGMIDPWKILGLPPGTPIREVKILYRRLAKQFHPDELEVLDEQRRKTASLAFIAIKEAYQEIIAKS